MNAEHAIKFYAIKCKLADLMGTYPGKIDSDILQLGLEILEDGGLEFCSAYHAYCRCYGKAPVADELTLAKVVYVYLADGLGEF